MNNAHFQIDCSFPRIGATPGPHIKLTLLHRSQGPCAGVSNTWLLNLLLFDEDGPRLNPQERGCRLHRRPRKVLIEKLGSFEL
ncbi:hypothetical protein L218DRAFT_968001 [Marasmius fiardii PR-910]|nr:hypothetical protein L218DRAFT_968001 [Marasmius fiardii PR-910]